MSTEIIMPQLGESVVEGTISRWLKQVGDHVEQYEALLEVMTDKVDTEVPAPEAGVIREILVGEGQTVKVGTKIAILAGESDTVAPAPASQSATLAQEPTPAPPPRPAVAPPSTGNGKYTGYVSPAVAQLVAEHGVELGQIQGSGTDGRITKKDVLRYVEQRTSTPASAHPPAANQTGLITQSPPAETVDEPALQESALPSSGPSSVVPQPVPTARAPEPVATRLPDQLPEDAEIVPISPMRRMIAEHMVRSRRVSPHVTSFFEIDMSKVILHRAKHKADFERQQVNLTLTAYFVQAAVAAIQAVPMVNASYTDEGIVKQNRIHIGMAVALDEALIVPVLRDADEKNLLGLARAVNDLTERARTRRLKPTETQGGTFTISNHGTSGSLFATPIINQPQAAIMGVGAIQKRAIVVTQDGIDAIAIRPMCYVSLTIDHRLLDGAAADKFLATLKRFLEGYAGA